MAFTLETFIETKKIFGTERHFLHTPTDRAPCLVPVFGIFASVAMVRGFLHQVLFHRSTVPKHYVCEVDNIISTGADQKERRFGLKTFAYDINLFN